ncbi:hypothetical protein [Tropicibacter sp. R15_0]|uniref:hypothetical protein n=1 Tax=Tropicibacter sp. R15_0 TaxID=2821101 RepID=UPI002570FEDC|nr:hypothetical protein [Tropicibacter sp. R15_0]
MVVEANGGSLNILQTQNYDNYGADLATVIEQAVAQGVDSIATVLPAPDAQMPAIHAAIEHLGKTDTVMLGTFDLSRSTLDRVKAGTQAMAVDQTPLTTWASYRSPLWPPISILAPKLQPRQF